MNKSINQKINAVDQSVDTSEGVAEMISNAQEQFNQGGYYSAKCTCLKILADSPNEKHALELLGKASEKLWEKNMAITAFRLAHNVVPENLEIYHTLIRLYLEQANAEEAFVFIERLIDTIDDAEEIKNVIGLYEPPLLKLLNQYISENALEEAEAVFDVLKLGLDVDSESLRVFETMFEIMKEQDSSEYEIMLTKLHGEKNRLAKRVQDLIRIERETKAQLEQKNKTIIELRKSNSGGAAQSQPANASPQHVDTTTFKFRLLTAIMGWSWWPKIYHYSEILFSILLLGSGRGRRFTEKLFGQERSVRLRNRYIKIR